MDILDRFTEPEPLIIIIIIIAHITPLLAGVLLRAEAQHQQRPPQVTTGEHLSNYTSKRFSWAVISLAECRY